MTTAVVEQGQKKEAGAGLGVLVVIGLVMWLLSRKKEEGQGAPEQGKPEVKVVEFGWEGSPQAATITKLPGDSFTGVVTVDNTGGAGNITFQLHIGRYWRRDDIGQAGSPWTFTRLVPKGRSTIRASARLNPANKWNGDGSWQDAWLTGDLVYHKVNCFRINAVAVKPRVEVLTLSWL